VVALTSIVFAIIEGPEIGWTDPITIGAFVVGAVGAVLFVLWELSQPHPLLDPRLFLIPRFGLGSLTVTMSFLVMFGMFYLITLYLQFVLGYSALDAAVRLLPFSLVMILLAPRSPQLTARFGTRQVVAAGFLVQAVGFLLATQLDVETSYWYLLAVIGPMAAGMALLMPPTTNAIMMSLPQSKAGVASAVNDTTREVGGAVGIALLGTLLTTGYQSSLGDATDGLPPEQAEAARDSIGGAMHVAAQLGERGEQLAAAARDAFVTGAGVAFGVAAAIGLVMAIVIRRLYPTDQVERRVEERVEA
jgi:Na+/melibiose symporter-like transporter